MGKPSGGQRRRRVGAPAEAPVRVRLVREPRDAEVLFSFHSLDVHPSGFNPLLVSLGLRNGREWYSWLRSNARHHGPPPLGGGAAQDVATGSFPEPISCRRARSVSRSRRRKMQTCAKLQQTAVKQTATYPYNGVTHTHPPCPVLRLHKGGRRQPAPRRREPGPGRRSARP